MKLMDESGITLEGIYFHNCMQEVLRDLQGKKADPYSVLSGDQ